MKESYPTAEIARKYIAGGVVSLNRKVQPDIIFRYGKGSKIWDIDGKEYIDYHAAFAPHLLGHNNENINKAVQEAMLESWSLMGTGTTYWEARLAELLCEVIPSLELVQVTNTGSEATAHAIRLARAWTGKDHIILTMGGYNGWHNEVARAVMPTLEQAGERRSGDEYPFIPLSAGIPESTRKMIHIVNFNDLDSVEAMIKKYPVACIMTEPVLQNVGVIHPDEGYLEDLIQLCKSNDILCIFDEVKTGFRTSLSGYQGMHNLKPDLSVFGKAIANGYPLGVIGGRKDIMELFDSKEPARKVLIAGTYNAHPFNTAAAIATIEILRNNEVYNTLDNLTRLLLNGLSRIFSENGVEAITENNASAFCTYFMSDKPRDIHDILMKHDFAFDLKYRKSLIEKGIYHIPIPCKQGSISYSHTEEDIEKTLEMTELVIKKSL
ncbi:aspartate aminotransferase family protein [Bacteroidota bacterium]